MPATLRPSYLTLSSALKRMTTKVGTWSLAGIGYDGGEACESGGLSVFERAEFGHVDEKGEGSDVRDAGDRNEDGEASREIGVGLDARQDSGLEDGDLARSV